MCRCLCIIILWVSVKCLSFGVCIYSSCPFLIYFLFMLMLIRYDATSSSFFSSPFFWGRGGMAPYKMIIIVLLEVTFELC